jgi:hypothetical protein
MRAVPADATMTEEANTKSNSDLAEERREERVFAAGLTMALGHAFFGLTVGLVWAAAYLPPGEIMWGWLSAKTGVPVWVILFLQACGLFLLIPFGIWHWGRLMARAYSDGYPGRHGAWRLFVCIPRRHPDLRMSRWIVLLVIGAYSAALYTCSHTDEAIARRKREQSRGRQGSEKVVEPASEPAGK